MSIENIEKPTVDELLKKCEEILKEAKMNAVERLKQLTKRQAEENEIFCYFELFDLENYSLSYNKAHAVKGDGQLPKIEVAFGPAFEDMESFIPQLDEYLSGVFESFEYPESESQGFTKKHEDLIFKWFGECWADAGGKESLVPTYFCFGPTFNEFRDLFTGEVLNEVKAAEKAGIKAVSDFA